MRNVPIGQYLVEKGLITNEQLNKVLSVQQSTKGRMFGDIVVELGYITDVQFAQVLSERLNVPFLDLETSPISLEAVKKIPEAIARKYNVIAISINGRRLTVATNDPINFYIFEDLKVISGMDVTPILATKAAITKAIGKLYSMQNIDSVVENVNKEFAEDENSNDDDFLGDRIENAPIVKLATTIVENAFRAEATDIHIEPFRTYTRIRIRVNGDMVEMMQVSNIVHTSLVTRYKIISGMNIAEKRIPQDGRFTQIVDDTTLDVRVSSLPTVNGEKIVIRLLSTGDVGIRKLPTLE